MPKSRTIDREIENDLFEQFVLLSFETTLEIHFNSKTHGLSTGEESLCKSNPKEQCPGLFTTLLKQSASKIQIIPYYNKRGTDMIQNWFSSHQKIDPVAGGKAPYSKGNLGIVLTKPCLNF